MANAADVLKKRLRSEIRADEVYPLPVFYDKTGLGRKAVAALKRKGMPVRKSGRNSFVLGADFIAALIQSSEGADQ